MKAIYFALILLIINTYVNGQLDKQCRGDNECDTSNKFQCIQNFCRCKIGYRKIQNNPQCVLVPGTTCDKREDCENFPGSVCDDNKKCICEGGYTAGKTECDKIGNPGDSCNTHAECIARLNDNSECKANMCICKEGYHEGINQKCLRTAGLEDNCESNDDCYLNVNDQNALECTPEKFCKCREGFTQNENTCNGSVDLIATSVSIMIFLIMGLFKFN